MRILTLDEILKLHAAVVSAQLVASRSALLVGIEPRFVAGLPDAPSPSDQILEDLNAMNEAGVLADGSFPLELWLRTAVARAGGKEEAVVFEHALARCRDTTATKASDPLCPFPGLEFFDEDRAADFFGREAEVSEALAQLGESRPPRRWLQIDGPSGAGKSSFARAGLVPAVRGGRLAGGPKAWAVAIMRPGPDPITSLAEALVKHAKPPFDLNGRDLDDVTTKLRSSTTALASMLREGRPDGHGVFLLVDQLEEAFTLAHADDAAVRQFDALLAAALEDREGPLLLITTIRSDFVARMGELPALERMLPARAVRYYLRPMDEAGLRAAIEKPAERAQFTYEKGLVDRIVQDASTSQGALPLVAHALQALYALRDGRTMTLRVYEELGGVGGALAKSADGILHGLDDDGRERARKILLRLVKIGRGTEDIRQTAQREDVLGAAGGGPEAEQVLTRLSGGRTIGMAGASDLPVRLVVVSGDKRNERVDLVHETLIQRWETLRGWLKEERQALELRDDVEEAARIWGVSGAHEDGLPKGSVLVRFRAIDPTRLKEAARTYLSAAEQAEQRSAVEKQRASERLARLQRTAIVGLLGLVFTLAIASVAFVLQRDYAREESRRADAAAASATGHALIAAKEARIADARRIAAQSQAAWIEGYPQRHILLAAEGWHRHADLGASTVALQQTLSESIRRLPSPVLAGHSGAVLVTAFSPDGRLVVTASRDRTIQVWSTKEVERSLVLIGHDGPVESLAFSSDGRRLVSASDDKTARVWRVDGSGEPIVLRGHENSVRFATFGRDDSKIITASNDKTVRIWDIDKPGRAVVLRGHDAEVTSAALSPDSSTIATASMDGTARIWSVDDASTPITLGLIAKGQACKVPKGALSVSGMIRSYPTVAFSSDGHRVLTKCGAGVQVWGLDGKEQSSLGEHESTVSGAAFSPGGRRVVTVTQEGMMRIWDTDHVSAPIIMVRASSQGINDVEFSPDERKILTAGHDGTARVWNANGTGEPIILRGHEGPVWTAVFSPDGSRIVTGSFDNTARLWRSDGSEESIMLPAVERGVMSMAFSADLGRVAVAAVAGVYIRRADGTGESLSLPGHEDAVRSARFDTSGEYVVTASNDRTARVWRADGFGDAIVLRGHGGPVSFAAFNPDGTRVVTASDDRTAKLWRMDDASRPLSLVGHTQPVRGAAFSPDGRRVVTASSDKTARLWDVDGADEPTVLHGHEDAVWSAEFSPDGQRVATASVDRTVRLWRVDGDGYPIVLVHELGVNEVTWSPDGRWLLTKSGYSELGYRELRVWNISGDYESLVLGERASWVSGAAFSPDSKRIIAVSRDGKVRVWIIDGDLLAEAACARAGRNLSRQEWLRFFGSSPYHRTCEQWSDPEDSLNSAPVVPTSVLFSPSALPHLGPSQSQ